MGAHPLAALVVGLAPLARAQDMLAVSSGGDTVVVSSASGDTFPFAAAGAAVTNGLAKDSGGSLFAVRDDAVSPSDSILGIDVATGLASPITSIDVGGVRALAFGQPGDVLYAAVPPSQGALDTDLRTVDLATGATTRIGGTGLGIAGMAFASGTLYGWDVGTDGSGVGLGLVTIDPLTAAASDVNPALGGSAADVQTLAFDGGGRLFGAHDELFEVDLATGALTLIGAACDGDLRGIEFAPVPPLGAPVEVIRLGVPPNPNAFLPGLSGGPRVGVTWDPTIAPFLPGAIFDFIAVTLAPANVPSGFGTILCDPASLVEFYACAAGAVFALNIPDFCELAGLAVCTQGGSITATGGVALTNAIDVVIGVF